MAANSQDNDKPSRDRIEPTIEVESPVNNGDYKDVPNSPLDENYRNSDNIFYPDHIDDVNQSQVESGFTRKDRIGTGAPTKADLSITDSRQKYSRGSFSGPQPNLVESTRWDHSNPY